MRQHLENLCFVSRVQYLADNRSGEIEKFSSKLSNVDLKVKVKSIALCMQVCDVSEPRVCLKTEQSLSHND